MAAVASMTRMDRSLLQVLGHTVGAQDVKTAFHEVAHDVFAGESLEMQQRLVRGVSRLTDEGHWASIPVPTHAHLRSWPIPVAYPKGDLQEERLVDATAQKLLDEGFTPSETGQRDLREVRSRIQGLRHPGDLGRPAMASWALRES